jgi:hypothetical protein
MKKIVEFLTWCGLAVLGITLLGGCWDKTVKAAGTNQVDPRYKDPAQIAIHTYTRNVAVMVADYCWHAGKEGATLYDTTNHVGELFKMWDDKK